mmetsp:Transcript_28711/g.96341  ORF Transcript_28711/g.96341 Transcript_28711/m.96341 type:complete len:233 (+) Transcript_28711:573-1271(+)
MRRGGRVWLLPHAHRPLLHLRDLDIEGYVRARHRGGRSLLRGRQLRHRQRCKHLPLGPVRGHGDLYAGRLHVGSAFSSAAVPPAAAAGGTGGVGLPAGAAASVDPAPGPSGRERERGLPRAEPWVAHCARHMGRRAAHPPLPLLLLLPAQACVLLAGIRAWRQARRGWPGSSGRRGSLWRHPRPRRQQGRDGGGAKGFPPPDPFHAPQALVVQRLELRRGPLTPLARPADAG